MHVLRALRVGSCNFEHDLCGFLLRSLFENLALVLSLDGRCRGTAADLDLGWCFCYCGAGRTGSRDVFDFVVLRIPFLGSFFFGVIIGIVPDDPVAVCQYIAVQSHLRMMSVDRIHPAGKISVGEFRHIQSTRRCDAADIVLGKSHESIAIFRQYL